MKSFSGYVDDACARWLASAVSCCEPGSLRDRSPVREAERSMSILYDSQPRLVPPPIPEPQDRPSSRSREWVDRTRSLASRASSRGSFSVRRKLNAYNGPRREPSREPRRTRVGLIGPPSDFRHVENAIPRRSPNFRPLELSIYMSENQLSPILPHFGHSSNSPHGSSTEPSYPPTAVTHLRSESVLSFQIRRKPVRSSSGTSTAADSISQLGNPSFLNLKDHSSMSGLPRAPPAARLRVSTEQPAYERVKSALHEKFELEQRLRDIEVIIEERQSLYMSSRPTSRVASTRSASSIYEDSQEPMPHIMPPYVTAVQSVQRPETAPSRIVHIPHRAKSFTEASAAFTAPQFSSSSTLPAENAILPPPLPLMLEQSHPPLRKKKSFSRVSNWLFPASPNQEHARDVSLDSVTNTPKPVTSREGFYRCVDMNETSRMSMSADSIMSTLESDLDEPTIPTAWTPDSSPGRGIKMGMEIQTVEVRDHTSLDSARQDQSLELTRVRTFGETGDGSWRVPAGVETVGIAF
ncbi:hypothetical protein PVAG01_09981 [Phlyctema vagabunda]|uniref:Uncharacterized protein n=1 Tax=Phlyctema vagabunda TaxID=108571 RepID=A0ABR4P4M3_9HELO